MASVQVVRSAPVAPTKIQVTRASTVQVVRSAPPTAPVVQVKAMGPPGPAGPPGSSGANVVMASGDTSGVTDTAAIQANENAGKATILVSGATYYVKALVKKSSCDIYVNGATVKLPNGANTDVIVGDQFATLTGGGTTGGIHDFGIHGPGFIDGNKANQTVTNPTVNQANFNLSSSFTLVLSSTAGLGSTGTATVLTGSGIQQFSWTANNTSTNTLTCTSTTTGRVNNGAIICTIGWGIRLYGYNFNIDDRLMIHNCVADGLWTEWAPSAAVGPGTPEMESRVSRIKSYENGRFGWAFNGPHDSMTDNSLFFRNASRGLITSNGSILTVTACHGWGSPQIISFEDHTGSRFIGCVGEMTSAAGSRGWTISSNGTALSNCNVLWAGSGGNVGIEFLNSASGCYIDAVFTGGFGNGAVLYTLSGGGNVVKGTAVNLGSNPMVAGTPAASDVIDIVPGAGTTTVRYKADYSSVKVFNVETYGAKGDGTTDNYSALQATINAAAAAGAGSVVTGRAGAIYGTATTVVAASGIVIDAVSFKDLTGNLNILAIGDCSDLTIKNCHFTGQGTLGVAGRGALYGNQLSSGLVRCKIINNTIDTVGTGGIVFEGGVDVVVNGNNIRNTAEHGMYISTNCSGVVISSNTITGAGINGTTTPINGIKLARCSDVHVRNNIITNTQSAATSGVGVGILFEFDTADCSAIGNIIRNCTGVGIRVNPVGTGTSQPQRITIADNVVHDNGGEGIRCFGGATVKISGNSVKLSTAVGIYVNAGTNNVTISENLVIQSGNFHCMDITPTTATVNGNVTQMTGSGQGLIVRAGSTAVTVSSDNRLSSYLNQAGTGVNAYSPVGNSVAATTLGTVVKKVQAFDSAGNSIGYIPVYDAIT